MTMERAGFSAVRPAARDRAGGDQRAGVSLSSVDVYDPATDLFTQGRASASARRYRGRSSG
jgi:hypothetical protein